MLSIRYRNEQVDEFKCAFPFEGNWNKEEDYIPLEEIVKSLNVLSRLKGIETIGEPYQWQTVRSHHV